MLLRKVNPSLCTKVCLTSCTRFASLYRHLSFRCSEKRKYFFSSRNIGASNTGTIFNGIDINNGSGLSPSRRKLSSSTSSRKVQYVQGQRPGPKLREYFYYIDHQGMLFLDDARMKNFTTCFKDTKFLEFLFSRLRRNDSDRYPEFPYVSLCGREKNYVRCDDIPIVYTHLITDSSTTSLTVDASGDSISTNTINSATITFSPISSTSPPSPNSLLLRYNYGPVPSMSEPFVPSAVVVEGCSGRLYHPAPLRMARVGVGGAALLHTKLALKLAEGFIFHKGVDAPPTHLRVGDTDHELHYRLLPDLEAMAPQRVYSLGLGREEDSMSGDRT